MCPPHLMMPLYGYRRVVRKSIRHKRIHRFATDRMLNAQTPGAHKFWSGVMRACVKREEDYELDERIFD